MDNIILIEQLIDQTKELKLLDEVELDLIKRRADVYICRIFGSTSKYRKDIQSICFWPMVTPCTKKYETEIWEKGKAKLLNVFTLMKEELTIFGIKSENIVTNNENETNVNEDNNIFIVHGRDEAMKESVARTVESLNLNAIILHEQVNKGRTVIEKFEEEAEKISAAIVLLSGDDICINRENPQEKITRARQNVVFELGYFIGKLGRERVIALYSEDKDFQLPSDFSGVIYIKYDSSGAWKLQVGKELKSCGLNIDLNKLIYQ